VPEWHVDPSSESLTLYDTLLVALLAAFEVRFIIPEQECGEEARLYPSLPIMADAVAATPAGTPISVACGLAARMVVWRHVLF
jgi:hypothetical protein